MAASLEAQLVPESARRVERVDLFEDVRPFYGSLVQYELRHKVPTLETMCARSVIEENINFEGIPPIQRKKLADYKQYDGPKVFKCSVCSKFYSKQKKFLEHSCN